MGDFADLEVFGDMNPKFSSPLNKNTMRKPFRQFSDI